MQSIREIYHIGFGPSSSHTMGPRKAAETFREHFPMAAAYRVSLFGSLAATSKGHMTDIAIISALAPIKVDLIWKPEEELPLHPNGMHFEALDEQKKIIGELNIYSPGGGTILIEDEPSKHTEIYSMDCMHDILKYYTQSGKTFKEYVEECEGKQIWDYLDRVNQVMHAAIERGLHAEGVLPGGLGLLRRAWAIYRKINLSGGKLKNEGYLPAYALAVAEENAMGAEIVTAPTCGSSGVLPAVLHHIENTMETTKYFRSL